MSIVNRWQFKDTKTDEVIHLPYNPNTMSSPTSARNMQWSWGSKAGLQRLRGIDNAPTAAPQWTFGGVILEKDHYDLLLHWVARLRILHVTDHLDRTFVVMIQKYDPVERLPTPRRKWRADYTMTCLLLGEVSDA